MRAASLTHPLLILGSGALAAVMDPVTPSLIPQEGPPSQFSRCPSAPSLPNHKPDPMQQVVAPHHSFHITCPAPHPRLRGHPRRYPAPATLAAIVHTSAHARRPHHTKPALMQQGVTLPGHPPQLLAPATRPPHATFSLPPPGRSACPRAALPIAIRAASRHATTTRTCPHALPRHTLCYPCRPGAETDCGIRLRPRHLELYGHR